MRKQTSHQIAGTWEEWQAEKKKEAGDVLISVIGIALRLDCEEYVESCFANIKQHLVIDPKLYQGELTLKRVFRHAAIIMDAFDPDIDTSHNRVGMAIYNVCWYIGVYCLYNSFDIEDVLMSRWGTMSKRDFIANPLTGGRENE